MPNSKLVAARVPDLGYAADIAAIVTNAVADIEGSTTPRFANATVRDAAYSQWRTQTGKSLEAGMLSSVGGQVERYSGSGWEPLVPQVLRAQDFSTGGITSSTAATTLVSQNIVITAGDVAAGRRIVVHVRGNFGSGGNAPTIGCTINGANLDGNRAEMKLSGATSWFFASVQQTTTGTKTIAVRYRSASGAAVSAADVSMLVEVI